MCAGGVFNSRRVTSSKGIGLCSADFFGFGSILTQGSTYVGSGTMTGWQRRKRVPFLYLVIKLIGHLASSTLVFVALMWFEWLGLYAYYLMDSARGFPLEITVLVPKLRVGWFLVDLLVSGIVLLAGVGRFVSDLWDGE